jgi:hypothetical protein
MSHDLDRIIRQPWREIRRRIAGSPDTQLHAHKFRPPAVGQDEIDVIARFFQDRSFARFGAIVSVNTNIRDEIGIIKTVKIVLQARISEVVQYSLCREVKIIFESS